MDEEQNLASPIAGSIRGIRRSVSSSIFNPRPRAVQPQPDPVTTNLLEQNSLQLTTLSNRFERVAAQISSLNQSLAGIKDNLAVSESLERQREAAKQRREALLAEQGLREGKESALEEKIRSSLTAPVAKVAGRVQQSLFSLEKFFLVLAGGWLTSKGISILQALAEGNLEKLEKLKSEFTKGLFLIGGTITALTLGIGNTFRLATKFAGTVGRVAFGGLFRNVLRPLLSLLGKVISRIKPLIPLLKFGGLFKGLGGLLGIGTTVAGVTAVDTIAGQISPESIPSQVVTGADGKPKVTGDVPKGFIKGGKDVKPLVSKTVKPGLFQRLKNLFGANVTKSLPPGASRVSKILNIGKGKGIIGVILGMLTGQSLDEAIVSIASFKIITAKAALALAPVAAIPVVGPVLYGIMVLLAGIFGGSFVDGIYKSIKGFIFGKKEKEEKLPELTVGDILTEEEAIDAGLIEPVKSNNDAKVDLISQDLEGQPEIINFPMNSGGEREVAVQNNGGSSNNTPNISFGNIGDYELLSQSSYGAGN